jgi:hypothetical protein
MRLASDDCLSELLALLAMAIQEPVNRTCTAHLLEALSQRLPPAMQPYRHVVQRCAKTCRDTVTGFAENVHAPDNIGILRLEGWQDSIKAVADRSVELLIDRLILKLRLVDDNLSSTPSPHFSLMVDDRGRKDSPKPSAHHSNILKLRCAFYGAQRKSLQNFVSCVGITQAAPQKPKYLLLRFDERLLHCGIRLGGIFFLHGAE